MDIDFFQALVLSHFLQKAYDAIVCAQAPFASDAAKAVQASYDAGVTDEFMVPARAEGRKSPPWES